METWNNLVRSKLWAELETDEDDGEGSCCCGGGEASDSPTSLSRSPMHRRGPPTPLIISLLFPCKRLKLLYIRRAGLWAFWVENKPDPERFGPWNQGPESGSGAQNRSFTLWGLWWKLLRLPGSVSDQVSSICLHFNGYFWNIQNWIVFCSEFRVLLLIWGFTVSLGFWWLTISGVIISFITLKFSKMGKRKFSFWTD